MRTYIPLFESFAGKHLLIVDVQEPFSKWWIKNGKPNFVEDLIDYCNEFQYVYEIWDSHNADGPSYDFPNRVMSVEKLYGENLDETDIRELFHEDVQPELFTRLKNDDFEQKEYPLVNGDSIFYIGGRHRIREKLGHNWFYAPHDMLELFDALKRANSEIVLVGGADNECLYDIEVCLQLRDIPYFKNEDFVYRA